jgi:hypothetical protein
MSRAILYPLSSDFFTYSLNSTVSKAEKLHVSDETEKVQK